MGRDAGADQRSLELPCSQGGGVRSRARDLKAPGACVLLLSRIELIEAERSENPACVRQVKEHGFERRHVAEVNVRGAGDVHTVFQSVADKYGFAVRADDGKPPGFTRRLSRFRPCRAPWTAPTAQTASLGMEEMARRAGTRRRSPIRRQIPRTRPTLSAAPAGRVAPALPVSVTAPAERAAWRPPLQRQRRRRFGGRFRDGPCQWRRSAAQAALAALAVASAALAETGPTRKRSRMFRASVKPRFPLALWAGMAGLPRNLLSAASAASAAPPRPPRRARPPERLPFRRARPEALEASIFCQARQETAAAPVSRTAGPVPPSRATRPPAERSRSRRPRPAALGARNGEDFLAGNGASVSPGDRRGPDQRGRRRDDRGAQFDAVGDRRRRRRRHRRGKRRRRVKHVERR